MNTRTPTASIPARLLVQVAAATFIVTAAAAQAPHPAEVAAAEAEHAARILEDSLSHAASGPASSAVRQRLAQARIIAGEQRAEAFLAGPPLRAGDNARAAAAHFGRAAELHRWRPRTEALGSLGRRLASLAAEVERRSRAEQEPGRRVHLLVAAGELYKGAHVLLQEIHFENSARRAFRLLSSAASLYQQVGPPDSAVAVAGRAAALAQSPRDEHQLVANLARHLESILAYDLAIEQYRSLLDEIEHDAGAGEPLYEPHEFDRALDAQAISLYLVRMGVLHRELGIPDSAAAYFRRAAQFAGEHDLRRDEFGATGRLHETLGQPDAALAAFGRALEAGDPGRPGGAAESLELLSRMSALYLARGDPGQALATLRGGRTQLEAGSAAIAHLYTRLAGLHDRVGRTDSARANYRRALASWSAAGADARLPAGLNAIGMLHHKLGRRDSARTYLHRSLHEYRQALAPVPTIVVLRNLAEVAHAAGTRAGLMQAVAYYDSAATALEARKARTAGDISAFTFSEDHFRLELYERWALALLSLSGAGDPAARRTYARRALAVIDGSRAQELVEQMRETAATPDRDPRSAAEGRELRVEAPTLAYMAAQDTIVSWLLLPDGEVIVAQTPLARDTLIAWVTALHAGVSDGVEVSASAAAAQHVVGRMEPRNRGLGRSAGGGHDAQQVHDALSRSLLPDTIAARLPRRGEVVIVPHGMLALVPFATLQHGELPGALLGDSLALRFAPSLAGLGLAERRPALTPREVLANPGATVIIGNPTMPAAEARDGEPLRMPQLPGAGDEARAVAGLLGTRALTGDTATEAAVLEQSAHASVVHLATHGVVRSELGMWRDSHVVLAGGNLTVDDILAGPSLEAQLVVLSACQTALGNVRQSEGTLGLPRAFLVKGARTVVVSLWNVSDEATRRLMISFYERWLTDADRPTKAEALRRAQAALRADPRYAHPSYWAAFQVVGAK